MASCERSGDQPLCAHRQGDADGCSAESAQLTALQTQQQLGTQVLAIANQTPQTILALFK